MTRSVAILFVCVAVPCLGQDRSARGRIEDPKLIHTVGRHGQQTLESLRHSDPEMYRIVQDLVAANSAFPASSPAVSAVQTGAGVLSIQQREDGVHLFAFLAPDVNDPPRMALHAVIAPSGMELRWSQPEPLAIFARGAVPDGATPVWGEATPGASLDPMRLALMQSGADALTVLPTRAEIAAVEDAEKRAVMSKAVELSERALRADSMTDGQMQSYIVEVSLLSATLEVATQHATERLVRESAVHTTAVVGPDGPPQTPGECTDECSRNRGTCIDRDCGPDGGFTFPCLCCAACNLAHIACLTACVFQAM